MKIETGKPWVGFFLGGFGFRFKVLFWGFVLKCFF